MNNLKKSQFDSLLNKNKNDLSKLLYRSYAPTHKNQINAQQNNKVPQENFDQLQFQPISNINSRKEYVQSKDKSYIKSKIYSDNTIKLKNEIYDSNLRKSIQILKKQNQMKDNKIKELIIKSNHLYNKLRVFLSDTEININLEEDLDDSQKKIKRLQNLIRIKNQQVIFKIKVQASNLLEEFSVDKNQISAINELQNQNAIFDFLVNKLKIKIKDFKIKERENVQQINKDRIQKQKYEESIHFLTQSNQILKNSQIRTKQKLEDLKQQWMQLCDRLTETEKQLQQKDNEIFKIKKLYEDSQNLLLKANINQRQLNILIQQTKRQYDSSIRQLRTLLTNYNLQKKQLATYLQFKQNTIQQMSIRQKFKHQQYEKMNRQYIRWKQRYEWVQNEKQSKSKHYQQQMNILTNQLEQYKKLYNPELIQNLRDQLQEKYSESQHYKNRCYQYQQQLKQLTQKKLNLQNEHYKQIELIESENIQKIQNLDQNMQNKINQIIKIQESKELEKIKQIEMKYLFQIEERETNWKKQFNQLENLYSQKLNKLNQENDQFRRIIQYHLNQKQYYQQNKSQEKVVQTFKLD